MKKKIFCFDLDNVICKTSANYYSHSKPIKSSIKTINKIHENGNKIIIFTARGMSTFNGNILKAKKKYFKMTEQQLKRWGVKYSKLILGKPAYDMIIDDKGFGYSLSWRKKLLKDIE